MILVDAGPLYDLGQIGELELLPSFDGDLVIPEAVRSEVTVEPAATNLTRFVDEHDVGDEVRGAEEADEADCLTDARALLDATETTSDVVLIAGLLAARDRDADAALVSDDRRLRAIAEGLGATVTGTFGVVVRATTGDKYFSTPQAKRVIRRTDHHGLQMTGTLRERAIGEVGD
jgi:predicted nucleic acid-binding protein